jgi:hypothetical protein
MVTLQQNEVQEPKMRVFQRVLLLVAYCVYHTNKREYVSLCVNSQIPNPENPESLNFYSVIFQQDDPPNNFVVILRDYLINSFRNMWIGRAAPKHWAPRSPDMTPLDFFAWSFIKSKVYKARYPDLHGLRHAFAKRHKH